MMCCSMPYNNIFHVVLLCYYSILLYSFFCRVILYVILSIIMDYNI